MQLAGRRRDGRVSDTLAFDVCRSGEREREIVSLHGSFHRAAAAAVAVAVALLMIAT